MYLNAQHNNIAMHCQNITCISPERMHNNYITVNGSTLLQSQVHVERELSYKQSPSVYGNGGGVEQVIPLIRMITLQFHIIYDAGKSIGHMIGY